MREAFPYDSSPGYLLHDNDAIFGKAFRDCVDVMGIEEVVTAPRSPWQNPYVERAIGSLRRECLDHVIVLGEKHLRRILKGYLAYYHESRPHMRLDRLGLLQSSIPLAFALPSLPDDVFGRDTVS